MKISSYPIVGFYIIAASAIAVLSCRSNISTEDAQTQQLPEKVDFNHHIKPILSDRCYKCHGPDKKVREANLRFDTKEGAFALLDSATNSRAIVPGNVKKSLLVKRVSSSDPEFMMPRPESNLSLSKYEIDLLKKWIEQGAEWKPHWAFIAPEKSELPKIKKSSWPRNAIDHFILAKMEQEGLQPSGEAEKIRLIRRVSFDLTGLPPTLEEVDAFLADDSPGAYEKIIDHYLASLSYGERMAVPWLDLARYSDTHGYQDDLGRTSWPWRDWVINAFNENMPFDQFTTWQLAGDLLPDPTYDQKLATAFNRNHPITQEGGVVPEEYRVEYVADRTQTIATTFLGLTMQCSRCHDHKYDPILQKEFYQLFAFNNSIPEQGIISYQGVAPPDLPIPEEQLQEIRDYIEGNIKTASDKVEEVREEKRTSAKDAFVAWKKEQSAVSSSQSATVNRLPSAVNRGLMAHFDFDYFEDDQVSNKINRSQTGKLINDVTEAQGRFSGCVEFNGKGHVDQKENYIDLGQLGDFGLYDAFTYSFWMKFSHANNGSAIISKIDRSTQKGYQIMSSAVFMEFNMGGSNGFAARTRKALPEAQWNHVTFTYDGSGKGSGLKIYHNGELQRVEYTGKVKDPSARLNPNLMKNTAPLLVGKEGSEDRQRFRAAVQIDELQIYNRSLSEKEIKQLGAYDPIAVLLNKKNLNSGEEESLFRHYLHHEDDDYKAAITMLHRQKVIQQQMREQMQPVPIMEEMDTIRPAYVLRRGAYNAHLEKVQPGTPSVVMDFSDDLPKNRLGLAKWLLDPSNPLTARVIVNRYWHMIFGEGIVKTVDDFGSQGALPTHPKLLDWLAVEFIESGWDVKHMLKLMVSTGTYRQSSKVNPGSQNKDPQNVLLARAPQYRFSAEAIRDNVLALSGLLVSKIGGPSVKPYQQRGLWAELSSGRGTKWYPQETGEALYRKSLYTFWKRTVPPPTMMTFDAASRDYCNPKRQTTSTPLQALILLNDPQILEAGRVFAQRMIDEGGEDDISRLEYGFRTATSRYPKKKEMAVLKEMLAKEKKVYGADPDAADEFLGIGDMPIKDDYDRIELAAYTQVAGAIFNLDETVTKY